MVQSNKTIPELILQLLLDGQPHFSAEFRERIGTLEYRKPITILRRQGWKIESMRIYDHATHCRRPGYKLLTAKTMKETAEQDHGLETPLKRKFTVFGKEHLAKKHKFIQPEPKHGETQLTLNF